MPFLGISNYKIENAEIEKAQGEAEAHNDDDDVQAKDLSLCQEALLVAVLSLSQFCTQVGVGGPLAISHIIGNDLHVSHPGQLSWLMAAYSLTVGTFILPSGRLGDVFGHKLIRSSFSSRSYHF